MWQVYAIMALFASSAQNVIDKVAMVEDRRIDYTVATLWRISAFAMISAALGLSGWLGQFALFFSTPVLALSVFTAINSLAYTYLLRRVEVTGIGAMYYLAPFLFLAIDTNVLNTQFSASEIAGIALLVLGGIGFAVDGRTHRLKRDLSPRAWLMLATGIAYTGAQAYTFKFVHAQTGVSPVSFTVSYLLPAVLLLLILTVLRGKTHLLTGAAARAYWPYIAVSKVFDSLGTIWIFFAFSLAAVSQVTAMQALEPLVLFVLTVFTQDLLRFRAGEQLGRHRLQWKAVAVSFLVVGGLLVN